MACAQLCKKRWGLSAERAILRTGREAVFMKCFEGFCRQSLVAALFYHSFAFTVDRSLYINRAKSQKIIGLLALFFVLSNTQNINKRKI